MLRALWREAWGEAKYRRMLSAYRDMRSSHVGAHFRPRIRGSVRIHMARGSSVRANKVGESCQPCLVPRVSSNGADCLLFAITLARGCA